jgi:cytochrome c553
MMGSRSIGAVLLASALAAGGFAWAQNSPQATPPAVPGTAAPQSGDVERGEVLFGLCAQCHGPDGGGIQKFGAPSIAGLSQWYLETQLRKFKSGIRGRHPDDYAGMRMRPMALTLASPDEKNRFTPREHDDVVDVAAYVAGLKPVKPAPTIQGGDAGRGAGFYAVCVACHGPDGSGNQALGAPPINHQSDWYLSDQLRKFRTGIRGADPRDQQGVLMRPMAMQLPSDQAIADVIAHIGTLAPAAK